MQFSWPPAGAKKERATTVGTKTSFCFAGTFKPVQLAFPIINFNGIIVAADPGDHPRTMTSLAHVAVAMGTPESRYIDFEFYRAAEASSVHVGDPSIP